MRAHVVAVVDGAEVRLWPWRWQPGMPDTTCGCKAKPEHTVWFTVDDKIVLCTGCCSKAVDAAKQTADDR